MLYIHTVIDVDAMFATVYRCRHEGALIARLEVQAHPVAGELVVHRRGFNRRIAKLLTAAARGRKMMAIMMRSTSWANARRKRTR